MDSDLVVGYFGVLDELGEGTAPDITWRVRIVSVWSQITNHRELQSDLLASCTDEENFAWHVLLVVC